MTKKRLILIDGHALLFRAYYAFPPLTTPKGELANAAYGFTLMLLNVIADLEPSYILVTFDKGSDTFRKVMYDSYKSQRKETPEDLIAQGPMTHELVKVLGMPIFEMDGFEADDLIGTLATQACLEDQIETVVVTGDKDSFQLVKDECVHVYIPGRRQTPSIMYDESAVKEKMGVRVDQIVDFKALAGDQSDNIPGVKGVGPKTAVGLLSRFETLENIYTEIDKILAISEESLETRLKSKEFKVQAKELGLSASVLGKLVSERKMAFLSQDLARIRTDVEIKLAIEDCRVSGYDKGRAIKFFEEMGFKSLLSRLPDDEFDQNLQEALF